MQKILLFSSLLLSTLLFFLHKLAGAYSLYFMLPWFDSMMHFLGGLALGALFLWFSLFLKRYVRLLSAVPTNLLVLCFVLLIGVGWELFEYIYDITYPVFTTYGFDTAKDLVVDIFGAWLVVWLYAHYAPTTITT